MPETDFINGVVQEVVSVITESQTVAANPNYTLGIDTSYYEGVIDWEAYYAAGCRFGSSRTTLGTSYVDPTYAPNIKDMLDHNVYTSGYHYFLAGYNPITQADSYFNTSGETHFPPCLDLESTGNTGLPVALVQDNTLKCLQRMETLFQRKPIIYTAWDPINAIWKNAPWLANYELWVANYTTASQPLIPIPWKNAGKTWTIWQFTDRYPIAGTTPDGNWFNGNEDALRAWIVKTGGKLPNTGLTDKQKLDILWNAHPELHPGYKPTASTFYFPVVDNGV